MRAAAGRVHDDDVGVRERVVGATGQPSCHAEPAVVSGERAAARLALGTVTRHPARVRTLIVARFTWWNHRSWTQPARSATDATPCDPGRWIGDATGAMANGEERVGIIARTRRGRNGRTTRLHQRGRADHRRMRQHPVEPEPMQQPRPAGARRLDLLAGGLHHPAEGNVRGADVLTRAAHETPVHERGERVVEIRAGGHRAHRRDPSTRRCGLLARDPVGRAMREAQAARHACRQVLGRRRGAIDAPAGRDRPRGLDEAGARGQVGSDRACGRSPCRDATAGSSRGQVSQGW